MDPVLDPARLDAVRATSLLDSPAEPAFDDLTRLAALLINAPLAFATIVDDARSFWKSSFGLPDTSPRQNTVEESFCQYVVRSRTELVVTDASVDARTRDNPSVASMGVRAWAGFPLVSPDGEVLGSFCVVDTVAREWSVQDLEVLRTLAGAASREIALRAAIEEQRRARRRAEDLAHTLQLTLLPPDIPAVPGIDVAACFHPAGTGIDLVGDFYDVFQSGANAWSFVLGDVCGKGVSAAKLASFARHAVGVASMKGGGPAEVLRWLNDALLLRIEDEELFLTALYGTISTVGDEAMVRVATAAHPSPLLRHANGTLSAVTAAGPLLGLWPDFTATEVQLRMHAGDALLLYTDGITEARNGREFFGDDRLREMVASFSAEQSAMSMVATVVDSALSFSNGRANDDMAVLVLRIPPIDAVQ